MKSKLKLKKVSDDAVIQMRQDLIAESTLCFNYIVLVITACLIATFGLLSNSTAVIIGAMLVAPIMLPLRGLAFGLLKSDQELSRRGIISIIVGTVVALILSMILGKVTGIQDFGSEVLARTEPTLIDLGIAVVAGGLSGFTKVEKGISDAVAGTAIAVALMPPLCVVGLTLSQGFFDLSYGATLLYLTNLIGIALACMIVFILAGYSRLRKQFATEPVTPRQVGLVQDFINQKMRQNFTLVFLVEDIERVEAEKE
ncbi:TIGR00341 family protein [Planktothrix agardhii]|uniref:TIGR00341 family protein n=1 Tax=Planktothrix agardhii TaxID=1160 RepID=UPI001F3CBAB9|nr:TIGR00341 family protein [Planktothrix agardhii]MCF3577255.1 TIGR00341 family protein [Planktothrix agardhii 1812]